MEVGKKYWWTKEAGVKYLVEVISTSFNLPPNQVLPQQPDIQKAVLVRVLAGVHKGMYAVVDDVQLSAFGEGE